MGEKEKSRTGYARPALGLFCVGKRCWGLRRDSGKEKIFAKRLSKRDAKGEPWKSKKMHARVLGKGVSSLERTKRHQLLYKMS